MRPTTNEEDPLRDFDSTRTLAESERSFRIGGETFHFRPAVEPDVWAEYVDFISTPLVEEVGVVEASLRKAGLLPEGDAEGTPESRRLLGSWSKIADHYVQIAIYGKTTSNVEGLALLDRTVKQFLVPEDRDRWDAIRQVGAVEPPVTDTDMTRIIGYMVEVQSGRPTEPASASGSGAENTGTTSTPESPSPEEATSQT